MKPFNAFVLSVLIACVQLLPCHARHSLPPGLNLVNATSMGRRLQQSSGGTDYQLFFTGTPSACDANFVTIQGQKIRVPTNLVVMFPAAAFLWGNVGNCSNLVLSIAANWVPGSDVVAGLIDATHINTVTGSGYIKDFVTTGVTSGGVIIISNPDPTTNPNPQSITYLYLNDPGGVYSSGLGVNSAATTGVADPRFAVDPDNPTVQAFTGYPMCIPQGPPTTTACPDNFNRLTQPLNNVRQSTTRTATLDALYPGFITDTYRGQNMYQYIVSKFTQNKFDPNKKAALQKGDYVTFEGYWDNTHQQLFVWSVSAGQLSLYTEPGYEPAYASWETAVAGTSGAKAAAGAPAEQAIRTRFEGTTTDPYRPVRVGAVDFSLTQTKPPAPQVTYREYGLIMPDYGAVLGGAQNGRWRFRPPCTNALPDTGNKGCTALTNVAPAKKGGVTDGMYYPAPREVIAIPGYTPGSGPRTWYQNPAIEYLFAEGLPGNPPGVNNFLDLAFLQGGYKDSNDAVATGPLSPFPLSTKQNTNGGNGPPTLPPSVQITNLHAAADVCQHSKGVNLTVCAWVSIPSPALATDVALYVLPYFTGSGAGVIPTQFPANFDFTLAAPTSLLIPLTLAKAATNTAPPAYRGCITLNAPRPSIELSVVARPTTTARSILGDTFNIPVDKLTTSTTNTTCRTNLVEPLVRYSL